MDSVDSEDVDSDLLLFRATAASANAAAEAAVAAAAAFTLFFLAMNETVDEREAVNLCGCCGCVDRDVVDECSVFLGKRRWCVGNVKISIVKKRRRCEQRQEKFCCFFSTDLCR